MIKWMKWRHTFSHGTGSWDWLEICLAESYDDEDEHLRYVLSELGTEYSHSEHYRGIEWHLHDAPDLDWLETHIKERVEDHTALGKRIIRFTQLAERLKEAKTG